MRILGLSRTAELPNLGPIGVDLEEVPVMNPEVDTVLCHTILCHGCVLQCWNPECFQMSLGLRAVPQIPAPGDLVLGGCENYWGCIGALAQHGQLPCQFHR